MRGGGKGVMMSDDPPLVKTHILSAVGILIFAYGRLRINKKN